MKLKVDDKVAILGKVKQILNQTGTSDLLVELDVACNNAKPDEKRTIVLNSNQVISEHDEPPLEPPAPVENPPPPSEPIAPVESSLKA